MAEQDDSTTGVDLDALIGAPTSEEQNDMEKLHLTNVMGFGYTLLALAQRGFEVEVAPEDAMKTRVVFADAGHKSIKEVLEAAATEPPPNMDDVLRLGIAHARLVKEYAVLKAQKNAPAETLN